MACLLVASLFLIYAISDQKSRLLENRVTGFFSGISMEIYLSHMVIFRVIERLGWNRFFGNGWLQYVITVILVLAGASVFAVVMQKILALFFQKISVKA